MPERRFLADAIVILVGVLALMGAASAVAVGAARPRATTRSTFPATARARVPRCLAAELAVGGLGSGNAGGRDVTTLQLANVSRATCFVQGRPALSFRTPAGGLVPTSAGHEGPGGAFATPRRVVLTPGARAGFVFTDLADNAPHLVCRRVSTARVLLPGAARSLPTPLTFDPMPFQLCGTSRAPIVVQVSSLLPAAALEAYARELPACTARAFAAKVGNERSAAGTTAATVTLLSRDATCILDGYPNVTLAGPSGNTILRLVPGRVVMALPYPALPRPITIVPGARARFQLAAGDYQPMAQHGAGAACPVSTALRIALPGGGMLAIHRPLRLCSFGGVGAFTAG